MQKWLKKTLLDDEHENEIDEMTSGDGPLLGWLDFHRLENAAAGTVKQLRGTKTHFRQSASWHLLEIMLIKEKFDAIFIHAFL